MPLWCLTPLSTIFLDGICYVKLMVHTYKGRLNNVFFWSK